MLTFGVDKEIGSCIKIYNNENNQSTILLFTNLLKEPLKVIPFGKPTTKFSCFSINNEMSYMAIGENDGTLTLFSSKHFIYGEYKE